MIELAGQGRLGHLRFYGVAVSTADSESADLGSNPSRTYSFCVGAGSLFEASSATQMDKLLPCVGATRQYSVRPSRCTLFINPFV